MIQSLKTSHIARETDRRTDGQTDPPCYPVRYAALPHENALCVLHPVSLSVVAFIKGTNFYHRI